MKIIAQSEVDTEEAARAFAAMLNSGDLVYLHGNLGVGKSVFARALIRALASDNELEVPSPTFTLVQEYDTDSFCIYHYDLYRIEDEEEIFELGWEDALYSGVTLVEWPSKLGRYQGTPAYDVTITICGNEAREIFIEKR